EPNQQSAATRVHLMNGIGPYPDRAARPPRALSSAAYPQRPAQGHQQLDAVMTMRRSREAWAAHDQHRGPGRHSLAHRERHQRILASHMAACKVASLFKTER